MVRKCWALKALAVGASLAVLGSVQRASAQCGTYSAVSTTGNAMVSGTTDSGNHGDDVNTAITIPFAFNFYGTNYTIARACSNGHIEFGTGSTVYNNVCPMSTAANNATSTVVDRAKVLS